MILILRCHCTQAVRLGWWRQVSCHRCLWVWGQPRTSEVDELTLTGPKMSGICQEKTYLLHNFIFK